MAVGRRQIEALTLAEGFFQAQVLFSANELGVFAALAEGPRAGSELARQLGANEDFLTRLLNACVALKLLSVDDGRYGNSELADVVLVPDRDGYVGNWLRLLSRWMKVWVNLTDAVRSGERAEDPALSLGGDPEYTRDFILGMHDYARLRGREIVRYLDLSGANVVDVGGGPGSYAVLFAQEWPDVRVTVFDLPGVVPTAARHADRAGVADRVQVRAGDYNVDEFGDGYDVVFLSDTLHQEDPDVAELILQKAYRALKPAGRVVVQGMFLNDDGVSPRWSAIYTLILALIYGGRAYTVAETIELLERAGFRDPTHRRMSLLNVNSLVVAHRPA